MGNEREFNRNTALWIIWIVSMVMLGVYFFQTLTVRPDKTVFLPGQTSHGHYQIEMACSSCHGESFTDQETLQESCMNCHGEQLKEADDDHPKKKFTDPRNADRIEQLDARYCVTCHSEHRPEITGDMGLTLPIDYCYKCHQDVAEDRPSHEGMAFDTCASAGCHNYHDNRALYEDFLAKHLDQPDITESTSIDLILNTAEVAPQLGKYPLDRYPLEPVSEPDAPSGISFSSEVLNDWKHTSHADNGVNCSGCHQPDDDVDWIEKPNHQQCQTCHDSEVAGFLQGKHGMRLNNDKLDMQLTAMSPADARLPFKPDSLGRELGCNSCHSDHRFDVVHAAVDGCLECHDDEHSNNYKTSPHAELLARERRGELPHGSGVSCATCHMPRTEKEYFWGDVIHVMVEHDQNKNLTPNEKMIRPVCMQCHGLGFSIDALADRELIERNFKGKPSKHIESLDLARDRLK